MVRMSVNADSSLRVAPDIFGSTDRLFPVGEGGLHAPRKTGNNLVALYGKNEQEQLRNALQEAQIDAGVRAEQLPGGFCAVENALTGLAQFLLKKLI